MIDNKVLFVDDSPTMRRIIKNSLQKIGFTEFIEAENGVDALDKLEGEDVGLILSDWNMPEMNGKQLVEELKSNDKYKDIPIIMITTRGMKEDVITAVKLGVAGYVVKPFTPEILKGKIQKALAK
ncbi:MAG: response regulator [Candidatus Marinimicrobia bacterium]|nr:response regulator [Candidatus Neomarinimicrobiota bacterium]